MPEEKNGILLAIWYSRLPECFLLHKKRGWSTIIQTCGIPEVWYPCATQQLNALGPAMRFGVYNGL
jgi:hypothetical protein